MRRPAVARARPERQEDRASRPTRIIGGPTTRATGHSSIPSTPGCPSSAWSSTPRSPTRRAGPRRSRPSSRSLGFELAVTGEVANPFGYSRQLVQSKGGASTRRSAFFFPHDTETAPWWQGENARLGSMAAAARLAARRSCGMAAVRAILTASGRSELAGPAFATSGAISSTGSSGSTPTTPACSTATAATTSPTCSSIPTSTRTRREASATGSRAATTEDTDIDFGLRYAETGKDDDWRWAEQWLPHAAWYLVAISIGD